MIYSVAKYLIHVGLTLFFRKRYLHNLSVLETHKPLLVCANHPNSFLDAMIIMVFSKRRYYVLVRADVFVKPWVRKILRKFNLIPIYRMRDGFNQLGKNNQTFEECVKILENNGAIIIFPEASCVMERKLRPLQKGASKIAFLAEEKHNFKLGVEVVCVGLNYQYFDKAGGYLHVRCSNRFPLSSYKELYTNNAKKAFSALTVQIENSLKEQLAVIEHRKDEIIFEYAIKLFPNINIRFNRIKNFAQRINELLPESRQALLKASKTYFRELRKWHLSPKDLDQYKTNAGKRMFSLLLKSMKAIMLLPLFVIGVFFHFIPFFIPFSITKKVFKKDPEFISAVNLSGSIILLSLFYLGYLIGFSYFFHSILSGFLSLFIIIFCGVITHIYIQKIPSLIGLIRLYLVPNAVIKHLIKSTKNIRAQYKSI